MKENEPPLSVGIDVGVRKGLDVVVLDSTAKVVTARAGCTADEVELILCEFVPAVVAIDSPPGISDERGRASRTCEVEMRALGINVFSTPSDPDRYARPFYDWMRVGEDAYAAAERAGYPRQELSPEVEGRALEVFPHASDVFLRGCLPPSSVRRRVATRRQWRLETLKPRVANTEGLCRNARGDITLDSIDAALAALTGLLALGGDFTSLGVPDGWLVVPGTATSRFERGPC